MIVIDGDTFVLKYNDINEDPFQCARFLEKTLNSVLIYNIGRVIQN